ncbi:MAG: hypothetical protein AAFP20_05985 [Cyanobacteria bacterium J06614_10]
MKDIDSLYKGRYEELRQVVSAGVAAANRGELIDSERVFDRLQRKLDQKRQRSQRL